MRSTVSMLLLSLLILPITSQGIRLEEQSLAAFHDKGSSVKGGTGDGEAAVIWRDEGHFSGTLKEERSIRAVREVHHRLPGFHEDYYGPRDHKPKHH